jgi:phosphatidylinositol-3-phosphatase
MRRIAVAVALALSLVGCATLGGGGSPSGGHRGLPHFSHVVIVVMENHDYGQIIGNPDAPYINSLARRHALSTGYQAIAHPSLPNYLALIGGSTFGVHSNCMDCLQTAPNLVDQLEAHGISWKAYMEDMPSPCFTGSASGNYAKKHNPFVYFTDITSNPGRCRKVVPLTQVVADLGRHALPQFAFITPDRCHDMHDCSERTGDTYLSQLLPTILRELGPSGVLFLTWDEGRPGPATTEAGSCCPTAQGGQVVMIAAGPGALQGASVGTAYNHYSLLLTIEEAWGLERLGLTACSCVKPLSDLLA